MPLTDIDTPEKAGNGTNGWPLTVSNNVTLDLNGKKIDRGIYNDASVSTGGNVITVNTGASLTINDSWLTPNSYYDGSTRVEVIGGLITGGYNSGYGGGIYVNGGTLIMNAGTIAGNKAEYGGGVYVASGSFSMSGSASVSGNNGRGVYIGNGSFEMCGSALVSGNSGGGVYVYFNSFSMRDSASVSGNGNRFLNGGGVFIEYGRFSMSGSASIIDNMADHGGGVLMTNSSIFNMSGGKISDNSAKFSGGGVYVAGLGIFNLSNSPEISGNRAQKGGGVKFSAGTFNISGSPVISNNMTKSGTYASNVVLSTGKTVTLSGGLTSGASVGISMETPGIFTDGYSDYNTGAPSAYFSSDYTTYGVGLKKNSDSGKDEAALGFTVTYDGNLAEGETIISGTVPEDPYVYHGFYYPYDAVYVIFPDPSLVKKARNGTISVFTGWTDGTKTYTSGGTDYFTISANTTLKAKWVDTVTKFEMDGADAKYFFSLHEALAAAARRQRGKTRPLRCLITSAPLQIMSPSGPCRYLPGLPLPLT